MPRDNFQSVAIPKTLYKAAEDYVEQHPELGYSGVPELLREFIREKIAPLLAEKERVAQEAIQEVEGAADKVDRAAETVGRTIAGVRRGGVVQKA